MKGTGFQCAGISILLVCCGFGRTQESTASSELPSKVSLCDLYSEPQRYAGKMVQVRVSITSRQEPELQDFSTPPCSRFFRVLLVLPKDVNPKPDFNLEPDASFEKYQEALRHPWRIEATLEGRFDSVLTVQEGKRVRSSKAYGKKHLADGRIVLRRMSEVATWPIPSR